MQKLSKTIVCVLLVITTSLFIPACSDASSGSSSDTSLSDGARSEERNTAMLAAYEAIAVDKTLADVVSYREDDDMLVIKESLSDEQLSEILRISEPFVVDDVFRIDIGKEFTVKNSSTDAESRDDFYTQLAKMQCESVELAVQIRESDEFKCLSEIPHLSSLVYTKTDTNFAFPAMPSLRKLTIVAMGERLVFNGLEQSPELEEIVVIANDTNPKFDFPGSPTVDEVDNFADVYTLPRLSNLRSVEFITYSGESLDKFRGKLEETEESLENTGFAPLVTMAVVCDVVRTMPSLESLNGTDPATYDPTAGFSEEQKQLFEEYRASEFAKSVSALAWEGSYSEGTEEITGPVIVWCARDTHPQTMLSSPADTSKGEDYQGISQSLFTTDPRACAQVILVYPLYEEYGNYYAPGGAITSAAYKTHTQVVVVDVSKNTVSAARTVAVTEPPFSSENSRSGEYLPEEALPFIRDLLG